MASAAIVSVELLVPVAAPAAPFDPSLVSGTRGVPRFRWWSSGWGPATPSPRTDCAGVDMFLVSTAGDARPRDSRLLPNAQLRLQARHVVPRGRVAAHHARRWQAHAARPAAPICLWALRPL